MDSFIKLSDIDLLDGVQFENLIYKLLVNMGFDVETTKTTGDGGIDLVAYNKQPIIKGKYIIQCKRWSSSVGEPILRDLYGAMTHERASKGILITSGTFTQSAIKFVEGKPLELIDRGQLEDLLLEYGLVNDNNNLSIESSKTYKSDDDYFQEGYAKCVYVESSTYEAESWWKSKTWGKIEVSPDTLCFKGLMPATGGILGNLKYLGVQQDNEPNSLLRGYKLKGSATRLIKITILHPLHEKERKVFIFEASYNICDELIEKIGNYIRGVSNGVGNKNCFVATVVYESNECIQVNKLRQWRDNYLCHYTLGRIFIKFYYKYGEGLSIIVDKHPFIKRYIKKILDNFVSRL